MLETNQKKLKFVSWMAPLLVIFGWGAIADTGTSRVILNFRGCINGCDTGKNVDPGESFDIIEKKGAWLNIKRANGETGWVYKGPNRKPFVKVSKGQLNSRQTAAETPDEENEDKSYGTLKRIKNGSSLNIRKRPTSRSRRVGAIENPRQGEPEAFEIIGQAKNGWYQVRTTSGVVGYVSDNYVEKVPGPSASDVTGSVRPETVPTSPSPTSPEVGGQAVRDEVVSPVPDYMGTTSDQIADAIGVGKPQPSPDDGEYEVAEVGNEEVEPSEEGLAAAETDEPKQEGLGLASAETEADICTDCDDGNRRDVMTIPQEVLVASAKLLDKAPTKTPIIASGCTIGSPYGMRKHPLLKTRRMHYGQDVRSGGRSLELRSPLAGTVVFRGRAGGYGNQIKIRLSNGYTVSYSHMRRPGKFEVGSKVSAGTVVGNVGSTGLSSGPHLHLEVFNPKGQRVNPLKVFKRNEICGSA
ncbi:peptidoglycan DD-metalloendopeptidase family protein [bacterium]|nr:peptidoglycan DD-metalloendopeptidase family protein [bacterium]